MYCPPTTECLLTRLQAFHNTCLEPQGTYEPIACKPSYYCPLGGKSQLVCPKGHYCPLGTVEPRKCRTLSRCPEGSYQEMPLFGFLVCGILDLFLVFLFLRPRIKRRWNRSEGTDELGSEGVCLGRLPQYSSHPEPVNWLVSLFSKESPDRGIELEFRNVSLRRPKSTEFILSEIHGKAQASSLTGIMGQSGSGKSTSAITNVSIETHLTVYSNACQRTCRQDPCDFRELVFERGGEGFDQVKIPWSRRTIQCNSLTNGQRTQTVQSDRVRPAR